MPFSDPLADGPTIQAASQRALEAGVTPESALEIAQQFRRQHEVPLLLMGYANPFLQFGWERLAGAARAAGVDGLIVPDLPPEECDELQSMLSRQQLHLIHLLSPNTPTHRIQLVEARTTAFIYAVSVTGVTGARERLPEETRRFLQRLRETVHHPVLVGFGVSGPGAARQLAELCDGVIVGSALIRRIEEAGSVEAACDAAFTFVRKLREALPTGDVVGS